jgi:hypothetical protein
MADFEHRKDSGRLMAAQSKRSEKSPDYWGEIAIDVKDTTKVQKTEDGYFVFKINGWKRKTKTGTTYLSLAVDRFIPKDEARPARKDEDDEDVPF